MKENNMLRFSAKGFKSLFVMVLVALISTQTLHAQGVNMDKYITLTVTPNQQISLAFRASVANTPIKVVSGTREYNVNAGNDWTSADDYLSGSSTMTIYGNLDGLDCSFNYNKLTNINTDNNTSLQALHATYNHLTDLDMSANTALKVLLCYNNEIKNLDISANTALQMLRCESNALRSLNVANGNNTRIVQMRATNNPNLICIQHDEGFDPSSNPCQSSQPFHGWCKDAIAQWNTECVNEIDTSKYIRLRVEPNKNIELDFKTVADSALVQIVSGSDIYNEIASDTYWTFGHYVSGDTVMTIYGDIQAFKCAYNGEDIQGLYVSPNIAMTYLDCHNNQIKYLNISADTALTELICSENQLTTLNVSNNTALTNLDCRFNSINNLNINRNTALTELNCTVNQLSKLDLDANTSLTKLYCKGNHLTNLDVSANTELTTLYCSNNNLSTLDITHNTLLTELGCSSNQITNLDVSANTALQQLYCGKNHIDSLDLSQNTALTDLECQENRLTSLNVNQNTLLESLACQKNQLTSLDVKANTALEFLYCFENQITTFSTEYNTSLRQLKCSNNPLKNLDVSNNTTLLVLYCHHNQLTHLDIHNNTLLVNLLCANNSLKQLDISNNRDLMKLNCSSNKIKKLDISNLRNLTTFFCHYNNLNSLNVANTNNDRMIRMHAHGNPNLTCIQHDEGFDPSTACQWKKDDTAEWSTHCSENVAENIRLQNNIQLYPNPTQKQVTVKINGADLQHISVYNTQGEKVLGSTSHTLNFQNINAGIYVVEVVTTDGAVAYKKLIKK